MTRLYGAKIGKLVVLGEARITGNFSKLRIGDQSAFGRCEIALHDRVEIGNCVAINDGAILLTGTHHLDDPEWKLKKNRIVINDFAWIATNAMILPGVTIGTGAVVGAGAVVRSDVPNYAVVIGNPSIVTDVQRATGLCYSPVRFIAAFESWLGSNMAKMTSTCTK